MADDHFKEELGRRTLQIEDLRDELWDARDRLAGAESRTNALKQQILRLEAEVGIRRAKANGLEDQAALQDAQGDDSDRSLEAAKIAAASELARLRASITDHAEKAASSVNVYKEWRRKGDNVDAQMMDMQARLESARRLSERARNALARSQDDERDRIARFVARHELEASQTVEAAQRAAEAASIEVSSAKNRSHALEADLASHRQKIETLKASLQQASIAQEQATQETDLLEVALLAYEAREAQGGQEADLATRREACRRLTKQISDMKRDSMMRQNGIQGALEETRRMFQDHLDQTASVPADDSLSKLVEALQDARTRANTAMHTTRSFEKQCEDLAVEALQAEADMKQAEQEAGRKRNEQLTHQIGAARRALEDVQFREKRAAEEEEKARAILDDTQRIFYEREMLLRAKLEDLWRPLRWKSATMSEALAS